MDILGKHFTAEEVQAMLAGSDTVNVVDWRAHTNYPNGNSNHPVVKMFWRTLMRCTQEQLQVLLMEAAGPRCYKTCCESYIALLFHGIMYFTSQNITLIKLPCLVFCHVLSFYVRLCCVMLGFRTLYDAEVTGQPTPPAGGFQELLPPFALAVHEHDAAHESLRHGKLAFHTCFNSVDILATTTEEELSSFLSHLLSGKQD